ncbi:hypothetical protein C8A01DRAFT_42060 [Parachaetomium inaequale]|uniref:Uncharacterized protein n=1 Tax=Parachaetomium inaequale TaxID=2588326 RepID=A0AAN6P4A1_9PEZI|nr:hypothetical protein C8A01DRAFT_42060 [Parachaetomium inaequale]
MTGRWRGIAPRSRGAVWTRAIGNDLGLTQTSFEAALSRAREAEYMLGAIATSGSGGQFTGRFDFVQLYKRNDGRFVPTFPASCPYVTAVGATDNVAPPVAGATFSSGGFSEDKRALREVFKKYDIQGF